MDARTMILWEKLPKLEKELADLKKDMDRLCQNDSVSRAEISILIKRLDANDKHIKELYTITAKLIEKVEGKEKNDKS